MKKIFSLLAAVLVAGSMVGATYTHSVGGVVGGMMGASYKGFLFGVDGLALQADLGVGLTQAAGSIKAYQSPAHNWTPGIYTFVANPNIVYQQPIKSWGFGELDWYAGGGLSLGMQDQLGNANNGSGMGGGFGGQSTVMGKFGLNAMAGLEIEFAEQPLVLGLDFRPGYGLGFKKDITFNYFDWALAASLRYRF